MSHLDDHGEISALARIGAEVARLERATSSVQFVKPRSVAAVRWTALYAEHDRFMV